MWLNTLLFRQTFTPSISAHDCCCPPAPLKSLKTLALYKADYYYYYHNEGEGAELQGERE